MGSGAVVLSHLARNKFQCIVYDLLPAGSVKFWCKTLMESKYSHRVQFVVVPFSAMEKRYFSHACLHNFVVIIPQPLLLTQMWPRSLNAFVRGVCKAHNSLEVRETERAPCHCYIVQHLFHSWDFEQIWAKKTNLKPALARPLPPSDEFNNAFQVSSHQSSSLLSLHKIVSFQACATGPSPGGQHKQWLE